MLKISGDLYNAIFGDESEEDMTKKSDRYYSSVFEDSIEDVEKERDCDFSMSHDKEVFNSRNKLTITPLD